MTGLSSLSVALAFHMWLHPVKLYLCCDQAGSAVTGQCHAESGQCHVLPGRITCDQAVLGCG